MDTSNMKIRNTIPDNSALTVESCMTVAATIDFMDQYHRHAVGVTVNGYFAGLFTRSDFIKRVVRCDFNPHKVAVGSVNAIEMLIHRLRRKLGIVVRMSTSIPYGRSVI